MLIIVIIMTNACSSNKKTILWQLLITSMTTRIKGTINKAAIITKVETITKDGRTTPTKDGEIILPMAGGITLTEEAETIMETRGGITITTTDIRIRTNLTGHLT